MKKLYNINKQEVGIDLSYVVCFYLSQKSNYSINTYTNNYMGRELIILIGSQYSQPSTISFLYSQPVYIDMKYVDSIDKDVDLLYKDLIEYFRNEKDANN